MTDIDPETLDALADDLRTEAVGADHALTSGALADRHIPDDTDGNPKTREAIKILMRERGLPVIGGSQGYYIPASAEPIEDALDTLNSRIDGIQERKQLLQTNWESWTRRRATDGGETVPEGLTAEEVERIEDDPVLQISDFVEEGDAHGE